MGQTTTRSHCTPLRVATQRNFRTVKMLCIMSSLHPRHYAFVQTHQMCPPRVCARGIPQTQGGDGASVQVHLL